MKRKKKSRMTRTSINIEKSQLEWLEKNHYNLSSLTRAYLNEFISTMEKTKSIMIPAWIKMKSMKTLKARAKKNPRLKSIIGD